MVSGRFHWKNDRKKFGEYQLRKTKEDLIYVGRFFDRQINEYKQGWNSPNFIFEVLYHHKVMILIEPWTNFSQQDSTWAKFSTVDVGVSPCR